MKNNVKISVVLFTVLFLLILFSCKKEAVKTAPVVSISTPSGITANSASSGGNVTADGGDAVTGRGVCWSTGQNPTTADNKTSDGSGVGSFNSSITGLNPGVTYTVKAYAINSVGTSYSSSASFSTLGIPATVTTSALSGITSTTVVSGGSITSDGGSPVSARGVCWSTSQNPTIQDSKTTDGSGSGSFISNITGLTPGATYYIRAYATNGITTSYGLQVTAVMKTDPATLTTTAIANITSSSVTGGGNITSDGGVVVSSRGVCWGTNLSPTTADSKTTDGSGTGSFTSSITGLKPGTSYYFRAYAINSNGTSYGSQVTATTLAVLPTLTTAALSSITTATATGGGTISNDGGATVTARGVCWNTSPAPTVTNSKTTDGSGSGSFISNISGLSASTTYYVRAYATNSVGTAYGEELNLKTNAVIAIATLSTSVPTSINAYSALLGGSISSDGNATVTERGVCYSSNQNPTTSSPKLTMGSGSGSFSGTVSGLSSSTNYYARAYAINSQGTAYGNQVTFTTASLPTVNTTAITAFNTNSASCGGNVVSDGGATITARGVCWSKNQNPTISDSFSSDGTGLGLYTSSLNGLTLNTTYYVRAYVTTSNGTAYGNQLSFTTDPISIVDIEGNVYKVVRIGTQLWMAENLKTTTYQDGSAIPNATDDNSWTRTNSGAYCWYSNSVSYKDQYGALYNWYAVNTTKLCPTGWRVPNDGDWTYLTTYLGGQSVAGTKMKSTTGWHNTLRNYDGNGTNSSGFTGLPGGVRTPFLGPFDLIGTQGFWWSSSQQYGFGWNLTLYLDYDKAYQNTDDYHSGFSVRCIR